MRAWITKRVFSCLAVAVVALAAGVARDAAADVILTGRNSSISASGSANESGPMGSGGDAYGPLGSSSTDFYTTFTDSQNGSAASSPTHSFQAYSAASQTSGLNTGFLDKFSIASGNGTAAADFFVMYASGQTGGGSAMADSFFDIFFDVTLDPVPYHLAGTLTSSGPGGLGMATVALYRADSDGHYTIPIYAADPTTSLPFEDTGVLAPGSYALHMQAHADASGSWSGGGHSSFDATLTVPEPSTLVHLGVGAIGFFAWAWRRRRS